MISQWYGHCMIAGHLLVTARILQLQNVINGRQAAMDVSSIKITPHRYLIILN